MGQSDRAIKKTPEGVVVVDFAQLTEELPGDLHVAIEEAFGEDDHCLGVLVVQNVPHLVEHRQALLNLAPQLAHLPPSVKQKLEQEESKYNFGWSHGKEIMNGKPDLAKGSFYANPIQDQPTTDPTLVQAYPEYYAGNLWPKEEDLPGFKDAFQNLGQLVIQVGALLAVHCDKYLATKVPRYRPDYLQGLIKNSDTTKARMLHYFCPAEQDNEDKPDHSSERGENSDNIDSWCGWHLDHSCLTGVTAAQYTSIQPLFDASVTARDGPLKLPTVPCPDSHAGLYIRTRSGQVVQVRIPPDCLAFQTGSALEIVSDNHLRATPHCVRGPQPRRPSISQWVPSPTTGALDPRYISRNTFVVFMQPSVLDELRPGYTFAEFTKKVLGQHYQ
ncbi:hypothetical protein IWQ62_003201 [Dispira parvispora]|uniref:Non-haem dioxygenase N-terminal domain-containing protein n=1 Tax=Dispira parvispora TaxID=1520584 RepID=A0A9W8E6H6_9FUNG|nr:hypothetical protein IWQ62_003201 [Dispira parvispora]